MGISKQLIDEREYEDYLDEYIYLQALYYEWEQYEQEELMKERGRIHTNLKIENINDESNSEYSALPF